MMNLVRKLAVWGAVAFICGMQAEAAQSSGELIYPVESRQVSLKSPFGSAKFIGSSSKQPALPEARAASEDAVVTEKSSELPKLRGLVGSAQGALAIIELGGQSSIYKAGDIAGSYRISRITAEEVEFSRQGANFCLRIGQ